MDTLQKIIDKYKLTITNKAGAPVEIPGVVRNDLGTLFKELGFKVGAEIGTFKGKFAEQLCKGNPDMKLYCVDPWKRIDGYTDFMNSTLRNAMDIAWDRLIKYDCEFRVMTSEDAVKEFEDNTLDFVYIDGNHRLEHVIMDISRWSKKIKVGGIISGHDYIRFKTKVPQHVTQAVSAYVSSYSISPWFVLGSRKEKPGLKKDEYRSWMWVKK